VRFHRKLGSSRRWTVCKFVNNSRCACMQYVCAMCVCVCVCLCVMYDNGEWCVMYEYVHVFHSKRCVTVFTSKMCHSFPLEAMRMPKRRDVYDEGQPFEERSRKHHHYMKHRHYSHKTIAAVWFFFLHYYRACRRQIADFPRQRCDLVAIESTDTHSDTHTHTFQTKAHQQLIYVLIILNQRGWCVFFK